MAFKVTVTKNKNSKELVKLYNTKDKEDAEKIYTHWILEADNGECIHMYSGNILTKAHVKNGNAKMEVLNK